MSLTSEPAKPFDFIIDGELLRKSLEQHLLEHNISPVSAGCCAAVGLRYCGTTCGCMPVLLANT